MDNKVGQFVIVSFDKMDELLQKINTISDAVMNNKPERGGLGDIITEKEAKEMLSKGTTWFWNKRQSGELTGRKAGNNWYYKRSDIFKFIENGKKSN